MKAKNTNLLSITKIADNWKGVWERDAFCSYGMQSIEFHRWLPQALNLIKTHYEYTVNMIKLNKSHFSAGGGDVSVYHLNSLIDSWCI